MQHRVRFQYRPRDSARPEDHEQDFDLVTDEGPVLLPAIGDHVYIEGRTGEDPTSGIVENRTFSYLRPPNTICLITVVLTDSPIDQGRLMKD